MTIYFSPAITLTTRVWRSDGECRERSYAVVIQPGERSFRIESGPRYPHSYMDGDEAAARRHFAAYLRELADEIEHLPIEATS